MNDGPVTLLIEVAGAGGGVSAPRRRRVGLFAPGEPRWCWPPPRRGAWRCCARSALEFTVADPGPDRAWPGRAEPRQACARWRSTRRGAWPRAGPRRVVIGADTVVVAAAASGWASRRDAAEALRDAARGCRAAAHEVWTGLAVVRRRRAAHRGRGDAGAVRAAGRGGDRRLRGAPASRSTRRAPTASRALARPVRAAASRATTPTWSGCRSRAWLPSCSGEFAVNRGPRGPPRCALTPAFTADCLVSDASYGQGRRPLLGPGACERHGAVRGLARRRIVQWRMA